MLRIKKTIAFPLAVCILLVGAGAFSQTDSDPSPEECIAAGWKHVEAEEYEAAIAEFQGALELGAATAEVCRGLCISFIELEECAKAAKALALFAELVSASLETMGKCSERALELVSQARLLTRSGHYAEGLQKCAQALNDSANCPQAHYYAALIYSASGNERRFIEHALDALAMAPDLPEKHCVLASAYRLADQDKKALQQAERAVHLAPQNIDIQVLHAGALFNAGKYSESDRVVLDVIKQDPDFGMAYVLLMAIKAFQGDSKAAYEAMAKADQLVPADNRKLLSMKIALSMATQRFDRSIELARDCLRMYPDDDQVLGMLATALMVTQQYDEAEETLQAALRRKPDSSEILCNHGALYLKTDRIDDATEVLRRAIELDPDVPLPHANLAVCYMKKGMIEEAKAEQEIATLLRERDPGEGIQMFEFKAESPGAQIVFAEEARARSHLDLGRLLMEEERFDEARSQFQRALELAPENHTILGLLAVCEIQTGSPEEAIAIVAQVISHATSASWAHHIRGMANLELGHEEEAVLDFLTALQTGEQDREGQGKTYFQLGRAYEAMGRFDQAMTAFEKAVKCDPDTSNYYAALAWACLHNAQFERAFESLEKASELDPEGAPYFRGLGELYELGGRYEEACSVYQQAVSLKPEETFALAWFHYRWDELDEALSLVNQLLRSDSESQPAHDLSKKIEKQNLLRGEFNEGKQDFRLKYFVNFGETCLPCSLAAVLNYWDVETTPQGVVKTVQDAGFSFSDARSVFAVAEDCSLEVSICHASDTTVEESLAAGHPVILAYQPVHPGLEEAEDAPKSPRHAVVITACDSSARILRIDDPGEKRNSLVTYDEAFGQWTSPEEFQPLAIVLHPPDRPVRSAECYVEGILRARYLLKKGQIDEALRVYTKLVDNFPDRAAIHSEMASACWEVGVTFLEAARKNFSRTLRIDPKSGRAHATLARWEQLSGNLDDAVQLFTAALHCPGHTLTDHLAYAKLLAEMGEKERAEQVLREGIEHHSDAPTRVQKAALSALLGVYADTGEKEKVELLLTRLIEIGKLDPAAQYMAARALYDMEEYQRAMQHVRNAILLKPDDACQVSLLAECHLKLGEWHQAIEEAQKAVAMHHEHSGDYLTIARAYQALGRSNDAIEAVKKELEVFPGNEQAKDLLEELPQH